MSTSLLSQAGQDRSYPGLHLPDFNYDAIKKEITPILMCSDDHTAHNGTVSRGFLLNNKRFKNIWRERERLRVV